MLLTWVLYSWYRLRPWELPEGKRPPPVVCWWPPRHNISSPLWIKLIITTVNWRSHYGRCVYLCMECNEKLQFVGAVLCCLSAGLLKPRKCLSRNAGDKCDLWFTDCGNTSSCPVLTVAWHQLFVMRRNWLSHQRSRSAIHPHNELCSLSRHCRTPSRHYVAMTLARTLTLRLPD